MPDDKSTSGDFKIFKDPIYGYVEIPTNYIMGIVDTPEFQRLRRINQTSYSPLYSSAIHNRFVHSVGVFHLGEIASNVLMAEILHKEILSEQKIKEISELYKLACLLHDVGHAPFSHTGEMFYKSASIQGKLTSETIHSRLEKLVGSEEFTEYLGKIKDAEAAAPHEIMSAIIGIKAFPQFFDSPSSKEFFARCITGYQYKDESSAKRTPEEKQICNCFISMLNSKVIDVDRLDYLIRDAYMTGYETVRIDYMRLLNSLTVVCEGNKWQIAYKKNALSIIENVVYAHDAEKKWIQQHPVVLYEAYIIKHIIRRLNEELNTEESSLFSEEALGQEGVKLKNGIKISLLCDDDIISLSKNMFSDDLSKELFDRSARRHPIWKTEAEYNAYIGVFNKSEPLKEMFEKSIQGTNSPDALNIPVISPDVIKKLEKDYEDSKELEKQARENKNVLEEESYASITIGLKSKLLAYKFLHNYTTARNMECDFVILTADMFLSNFSKQYLGQTLIVLPNGNKENVYPIEKISPILHAKGEGGNFFYMYYRKKDENDFADKRQFCIDLYLSAIEGYKSE